MNGKHCSAVAGAAAAMTVLAGVATALDEVSQIKASVSKL